MSPCVSCGHCCVLHTTVTLSEDEAGSGQYETIRIDGKTVLAKEKKRIPELEKELLVCTYYDPHSRLCSINEYKPEVCRNEYCGGTMYRDEYNATLAGIPIVYKAGLLTTGRE